MTIHYTSEVTTCKGLGGCFFKLLARWKGSIYKLIWSDLILYIFIYYTLNLTYYKILDNQAKVYFEHVVKYFGKYSSLVPLSFVLGFYVDIVIERWWNQYTAVPFPDNLAILIGAGVKGQDTKSRAIKRTLVRYICATFTMTLTMISPKAKKRFPTLQHFIEAGLLTKGEKKIIEDLDNEFPSYKKYWLPLAWAANRVIKAKSDGYIREGECVDKILEQLNEFRNKCATLLDYDWISVPLVYTQVVTIALYSYFLFSVIGNQYIGGEDENILSSYFPLLPVLEFLFYMGWLKVAETLTNPFGDDDDDFEVMWMIDRHLQVSYLLVDRIPQTLPKLSRDMYWDETAPTALPFTKASEDYMQEYPSSSTNKIVVSNSDQEIIMPRISKQAADALGKQGPLLASKDHKPLRRTPIIALTKVKTADSTDSDEVEETIDEQFQTTLNDAATEIKNEHPSECFENLRKCRAEEHKKRQQLLIQSFSRS